MISIIIPTYNRRDLLEQTLESVRKNDLKDAEIIVIDDGSKDDTREYLAKQEDLTWFPQANSGPSAARNLGASHAKGEYLAFLDSDDLWFEWTLATYEKVIEKTKASFIAGKPLRFENSSTLSEAGKEDVAITEFKDYLDSGEEWRWWGCSSFVIRKSAFEEAGGFADGWFNGEDADLAMRLGTANGFVQITAPHTFAYREHAISEMKDQSRNTKGVTHLLETQRRGGYPGFPERRWEQWRIMARHLRPAALSAAASGNKSLAWRIYFSTLPWHVKEFRWRFILGFLIKAVR